LTGIIDGNLDGAFGLELPSFPNQHQLRDLATVFPSLTEIHLEDRQYLSSGFTTVRHWQLSLFEGHPTHVKVQVVVKLRSLQDLEPGLWRDASRLPVPLGHCPQTTTFTVALNQHIFDLGFRPEPSPDTPVPFPDGVEEVDIHYPALTLSDLVDWLGRRSSKDNTALRRLTYRTMRWNVDEVGNMISGMRQIEGLSVTRSGEDLNTAPFALPPLDQLPRFIDLLRAGATALQELGLLFDIEPNDSVDAWPLTSAQPLKLEIFEIRLVATPTLEQLWRLAVYLVAALSDQCMCTIVVDNLWAHEADMPDDFEACLAYLRQYAHSHTVAHLLMHRLDLDQRQALAGSTMAALGLHCVADAYQIQFSRKKAVLPPRHWHFCDWIRHRLWALRSEWMYKRNSALDVLRAHGTSLSPPQKSTTVWLRQLLVEVNRAIATELETIRRIESDSLDGEVLDVGWDFEEELRRVAEQDEAELREATAAAGELRD
jgi:hypothetical protein